MKAADTIINGLDTQALAEFVDRIKADPARGQSTFKVRTEWKGGARTDTHVDGWYLGGEKRPKDFTISVDEPEELLGTNEFANPQEYLLAAMNACLAATYVAACSVNGIELESLSIESEGDIDLRGFLAIDASVPAGYEALTYRVRIKGDGTAEQFEQVHRFVQQTSPNYYNMARAIPLRAELVVE